MANRLRSSRHTEREAGFSIFRCHVDDSPMCLCNFVTDIKAQAEPFTAPAYFAAEERLEETLDGGWVNGLS
jgi:hypothetical protein